MKLSERVKRWAETLKQETRALYYLSRHPRVPWYAKALAAVVVAYALSPIDLIPDFIPVIGYLDDLILVPVGIYLVLKMIPDGLLEECRKKAKIGPPLETSRAGAVGVVLVWILAVLCFWWLLRNSDL